jgi:hypothetical protein
MLKVGAPRYTEHEIGKILKYLGRAKRPISTVKVVSGSRMKDSGRVLRILNKLEAEKKVARTGQRSSTKWELISGKPAAAKKPGGHRSSSWTPAKRAAQSARLKASHAARKAAAEAATKPAAAAKKEEKKTKVAKKAPPRPPLVPQRAAVEEAKARISNLEDKLDTYKGTLEKQADELAPAVRAAENIAKKRAEPIPGLSEENRRKELERKQLDRENRLRSHGLMPGAEQVGEKIVTTRWDVLKAIVGALDLTSPDGVKPAAISMAMDWIEETIKSN